MASSTPSEDSVSPQAELETPAKGTPEHRALYYKKIEDSLAYVVNMHRNIGPTNRISTGWLNMDETEQKKILSRLASISYAPDMVDITDEEMLNSRMAVMFASVVIGAIKEREGQPSSKQRRDREGSLRKMAIIHSNIARQNS
ncbi:hypothetical protein JR316_0006636 [Psilocybe cubensis]|uniref:Uncharacterized protein n=2 Tax=Psilocybe cubensis TaxID=181762 RepID=A0A8H8CEC6_PSICU|nr:hypothetical protein JR316_0006636 [Psilocybe cubensis]KAH9480039.1 hypothetical protein JR316_0006636 [Psilocybe cubensis]